MTAAALPDGLAEARDAFLELPEPDRLTLLLEYSGELPEVPDRLTDHPELFERVAECQSPVYIIVEIDGDIVLLHATAPAEAPTTRGFASILVQGLSGVSVAEALAVSEDFPQSLGLRRVVSPLRLSGMTGMLIRIKRQIRERAAQ